MLSGGQRQVVALARSATRVSGDRDGVLLLDEPTAALGYEQTMQVQALVRRMAEQGIAIVLVTHNLPLAMSVCDRIAVLNRGRKVADLPTSETDNDQLVGWITGARGSMF
jgi:ABC-type sugar transport system ATPase subunit